MSDLGPSTCIVMTVEIELPGGLSDEHQDALVDDLTYEQHIDRLRLIIQRWARHITGEGCRVEIDVE